MSESTDDLQKLRELTPLLKDFSYKTVNQAGSVEVETGACVIHGVVILPEAAHVHICRVGGGARIRRDHNGENEYIICLLGSLTITYADGNIVRVPQYESHHVILHTSSYSITGDNSRAMIVTVPPQPE
jgi:hypothetical protein